MDAPEGGGKSEDRRCAEIVRFCAESIGRAEASAAQNRTRAQNRRPDARFLRRSGRSHARRSERRAAQKRAPRRIGRARRIGARTRGFCAEADGRTRAEAIARARRRPNARFCAEADGRKTFFHACQDEA